MKNILTETYTEISKIPNIGNQASYIPELAKVDGNLLGVNLITIHNKSFSQGNATTQFSIQSIVKVLSLIVAYQHLDKELWKRVGVEPSGTSFNSLILLELEKGIPRNPFINAGAIVITDVLLDCLENPEEDFLTFVKSLSNETDISYHNDIYESEKKVAYKGNYSLVHFNEIFWKY